MMSEHVQTLAAYFMHPHGTVLKRLNIPLTTNNLIFIISLIYLSDNIFILNQYPFSMI